MLPSVLLCAFTFGVSLLTLFAGFGLGTLLLPAFALFLPAEVAVASTAVVHLANNLFKAGMLAGRARRDVLVRFGVPAVASAFLGAMALGVLSGTEPLLRWRLLGREAAVTPVKLVLGLLILGFALFELAPALRRLRAPVRWLPLGGALSGFFGGLSGHQGALRAAFLTPLKMDPPAFASTQAVIALMVDVARLLVYGAGFALLSGGSGEVPWGLVAAVSLSAFAGAFLGRRLLKKVTLDLLHGIVGWLLVLAGLVLASGL